MQDIVKTLKQYLEQNPPNYGDAESVLDMLYWYYTENNSMDSEKIKSQFAALRGLMNLPPREYDEIFYLVSDLCLEYGRLSFREGIRLSMLIMHEVSKE